jgi:hypothetical protein
MDIPMLNETEYACISQLYSDGIGATKKFRQLHNLPLDKCSIDERFRPVRDAYERMTGFKETNHNAIMHHRISLFGPPCPKCGKPFRTPKARLCAECGQKRE